MLFVETINCILFYCYGNSFPVTFVLLSVCKIGLQILMSSALLGYRFIIHCKIQFSTISLFSLTYFQYEILYKYIVSLNQQLLIQFSFFPLSKDFLFFQQQIKTSTLHTTGDNQLKI